MNTTEAIEAATVALHTWECGCEWGHGNHDDEGAWEGNRFVQRATIAVSALMEPKCEECGGSGHTCGTPKGQEPVVGCCPACNGKGTRRRVLVELGPVKALVEKVRDLTDGHEKGYHAATMRHECCKVCGWSPYWECPHFLLNTEADAILDLLGGA